MYQIWCIALFLLCVLLTYPTGFRALSQGKEGQSGKKKELLTNKPPADVHFDEHHDGDVHEGNLVTSTTTFMPCERSGHTKNSNCPFKMILDACETKNTHTSATLS